MMIGDQFERTLGLAEIIRSYEELFPKEDPSADLLRRLEAGENIWDRNNWRGHMTASAIVIDPDSNRCLMLKHRKLNKFLVPGGHCDPFELPAETALRELVEETGVQLVALHSWHKDNLMSPVDVDAHEIPVNALKNEPVHVHFDLRYLFKLAGQAVPILNEVEGSWLGWVPVDELYLLYPRVFSRLGAVR